MDEKSIELKIGILKNIALTQPRATGPKRNEYHWGETLDDVVLNAFTDHPSLGNEFEFARVRRCGANYAFVGATELISRVVYEFAVIIHNASAIEPARGLSVNVLFPWPALPGKDNYLRAAIGSVNAVPHVIWSSCILTCKENLKLEILPDSLFVIDLISGRRYAASEKDLFTESGIKLDGESGKKSPIEGSGEKLCVRFLAIALPVKEKLENVEMPKKEEYTNGITYYGFFKNGVPNGQGIMVWPSGESYEGEWALNNRHGYGELKKDGRLLYKGQWFEDKRNGKGTQFSSNGDVYAGSWKDDHFFGAGALACKDGRVFDGIWTDSTSGETGTIRYPNGDTYEGPWKHFKRTGNGVMRWADGTSYEGEWQDDKINGTGKMICANMDVHAGFFVDGAKHGKCVSIYANRDTYDGFYEDDKRNGPGTFIWENGEKYIGEWLNDLRDGRGTQTYANGSIYEGQWAQDKRCGYGVLKYASGGVLFSGEWIDGKPKPMSEAPDDFEEKLRFWAKEFSLSDFYFRSEIKVGMLHNLKILEKYHVDYEDIIAIQSDDLSAQDIRASVYTRSYIYSNYPPQGLMMHIQSADIIDLTDEGVLFWFGEHKFLVDFGDKNRDTAVILQLLAGKQLG